MKNRNIRSKDKNPSEQIKNSEYQFHKPVDPKVWLTRIPESIGKIEERWLAKE